MPSGFHTFVAGNVLTAAQVNGFLMEQSVPVFASAAARNSEITSPAQGQFSYLIDIDTITRYNGTAWTFYTTNISTARARRDATQSINDNTNTLVQFDNVMFDTSSHFDLGTNNTIVTILQDGIYQLIAQAQFSSNATGNRIMIIQRQSPSTSDLSVSRNTAINGDATTMGSSVLVAMSAGDTVAVQVRQTSGGPLNLSAFQSWLAIQRISPTP